MVLLASLKKAQLQQLGCAVVNECDWTAFMIYYNPLPLQGLNTSQRTEKLINPPEIQEDDIFFANIIIRKSRCLVLQVIYYLCALKTQWLSQRLEKHLSTYLLICLVRSF